VAAAVAASFSNSIFINPCSEHALEQQISVKDVASSTMPRRCSANFLSGDVCKLMPLPTAAPPTAFAFLVIPKQVKPLPETMRTVERKLSSTPMIVQVVLEGMQQRYLTTATCSLRPFLWDSAIELLEGMAVQNVELLDPLHAHGFDKQQWPPPTHWILLILNAQLRPSPWPSFWEYSVDMYWESAFGLFQLSQHAILVGLGSCQLQETIQLVMHIIPVCSELPNGWQINGCSSNSSCQVFTFSWISGLHLYLKLMVSQYTLQAILVIYALRFWFGLTSYT
jgi:hypothetical protein